MIGSIGRFVERGSFGMSVSFKKGSDYARTFSTIKEELKASVSEKYSIHPFTDGLDRGNALPVMKKYLAMSEAFPYIQAGAYNRLIMSAIRRNSPISSKIEKTFVVGSFLSWDETGGNYLIRKEGIAALPKILDTKKHFHAAYLKTDLKYIWGSDIKPDYCPDTREYLVTLGHKLGSSNHLERCATMVAFEMHAGQMIEALWKSLCKTMWIEPDKLQYFKMHVGGDDPGEEYHIELTQKLIDSFVPGSKRAEFIFWFDQAYLLNIEWCKALCKDRNNRYK
jgi:hypothetical protein